MQPKMKKFYTVSKYKTRSWLAQIMNPSLQNSDLYWRKVGKTTAPFRYDLNKIPYDHTVEVTNIFKGLDLIECLKNYGRKFMTLYRSSDQDHPQEKEMQKGKMVVWVGLINSWEKKRLDRKRRKGKIYPFECRVPKNSKKRSMISQWSMQRNGGKQ